MSKCEKTSSSTGKYLKYRDFKVYGPETIEEIKAEAFDELRKALYQDTKTTSQQSEVID